jgi:uncharacterized protein
MEPSPQPPLVVAFVADLMFTTRISKVISYLGYRVQWIEDTAALGDNIPPTPQHGYSEQVQGQTGQLFIKIAGWQPALLLFDLANKSIPWQHWMPLLKSSPATRRIPIMAFGPHTDVELMGGAKRAGADVVLARSRFTSDMPQLIKKYARVIDHESLFETCLEPLAPLALSGIEKFNNGQYYACHDDLEEAWRQDDSPGRDLYQGILQVAIAYYQIQGNNFHGAMKMLLRLRQRLKPLPPVCRGVNLEQLRQNVDAVQSALVALGENGIGNFDQSLFQPIEYKSSATYS